MKRCIAMVLIAVFVAVLPGCTNGEEDQRTAIGYIKEYDSKTLLIDEIEWINVPGDRATELGLTDEDAPDGFYIYNENQHIEEYSISSDCISTVLDWENNYEKQRVTPEELKVILEERSNVSVPYILTIENNEVVELTEQYIP